MLSFNIRPISLLNAAVSGSGVASAELDTSRYEGNLFMLVDARSGGTNNVTITVQHSDTSGSGFTAVPASAVFNVDTGDQFAFANVGATASSQRAALNKQQLKRYLRVSLSGTSLSGHNFAITIAGQPKYTESF